MFNRVVVLIALMIVPFAGNCQSQQQLEVAFPNLTFNYPVDLQHPGDGTDRLFVVEQPGMIRTFENSSTASSATTFLDIRDRVEYGGEKGLLGLAFHPDYKNNGYFYVNYTARRQNQLRTTIARFRVSANDANLADKNSELILLEFNQPYDNHNGGQIAFGPDGFLYIATGDGGSGGDPQGNGQNLKVLLGKILRLDVNNPATGKNYSIPQDNPFAGNTAGSREEIYAYGLRNPWRFSFDPVTGWLWAADVGQNRIEEIDIIEKGGNYGWNIVEGNLCYQPSSGCNTAGLIKPVWEYNHSVGASITGGHVYRGRRNPELVGAYLYGDFVSGRIWALSYDGVNPATNTELIDSNLNIASFGIDKNNELYICAFDGKIYRFKSTASSVFDSNTMPTSNKLAQNYPNPFVKKAASSAASISTTTIEYFLSRNAHVEVNIYNLQGQLIRQLQRLNQIAGKHVVVWDGRDEQGKLLPSGIYLYQLRIDRDFVETKRLLLVK
ncbi:MAG: PQQ-dependent sugar dehydrogenase [candidate division KSB1 bacterium]|nr:PQQ-dependent sugar dehydrogenase [candidate division KSB1 bacterium]MDZ7304578.1 PQQ-dependent sugar dehydrogenase [candidate division KSB1 bacterium]MDZ7313627.1 PQQ-dependent sugar dehydrogenase [candidate division KSB1 bacterium]